MRCPLDGGGKPLPSPTLQPYTDQYRLSAAPGYSVPTRAVRRPRAAAPVSWRTGDAAFLMRYVCRKKWQQGQSEGRACPPVFAGWTPGESVFDSRRDHRFFFTDSGTNPTSYPVYCALGKVFEGWSWSVTLVSCQRLQDTFISTPT